MLFAGAPRFFVAVPFWVACYTTYLESGWSLVKDSYGQWQKDQSLYADWVWLSTLDRGWVRLLHLGLSAIAVGVAIGAIQLLLGQGQL
jgi:hypothetical protein